MPENAENSYGEEIKVCSKCKSSMLLSYFGKNKKGELYKTCNSCRDRGKKWREENKEWCKNYQEQNKEHRYKITKEWSEKHKDEIKENKKNYYKKNAEIISFQKTIHREINKDKLNKQEKERREKNKDKIKEYQKRFYENNKSKYKEYAKNNKEQIQVRMKKWRNENKDHIREYNNQRYKDDELLRLRKITSSRVLSALKSSKSKKTIEYLGCDIDFFKKHIEDQFIEGMSWDNYGDWEIDHIIPVKYIENNTPPTINEVCERLHYTNTQPLWKKDNMSKSNRYIG
jgi:hypothetical protein